MMVAMRGRQKIKRFAGVRGPEHAGVEHVHRIRRLGIGKDVAEVPRALAKAAFVVDAAPVFAAIVRTIEAAAFFVFDHRIHAVGIRTGHRNADAPQDPRRQAPIFQPRPGGATVNRFVQAASGTATIQAPRRTINLP